MSGRVNVRAIAAVLPLAMAVPAALHAQYTQQVQSQMTQYATPILNTGYTSVTELVTGSLPQGQNTSMSVPLNAGRQYVILGVCDADCSDVDLALFGPDGSSIIADRNTDDHPTLRFMAPVTGTYRVQVEMATCRTNPCYYGVQVFGSSGGVALNQPMPLNQPTPMNQPMPLNQPTAMANATSLPMLGSIGINQQVAGNLAMQPAMWNSKPIQLWGFNCTAGQTFQMDILSSWDNYALVFDPNGVQVAYNDDGGEGTNARLTYTCQVSGTYRLAITVYATSTTAGAYTLQVQQGSPQNQNQNQPSAMAPGTVPSPMGVIGANQQIAGNLAAGASQYRGKPMQTWTFNCANGQVFQMDVLSSWDNYAYVFDPAGAEAAHDDDAGGNNNARIIYTCRQAGAYRLGVTAFNAGNVGAYTLQVASASVPQQVSTGVVQPVTQAAVPTAMPTAMPTAGAAPTAAPAASGDIAAPGQQASITTGETRRGRLEVGDQRMNDGTWADLWVFQGRQGQRVRIECRSDEFDTYLQLLDPQQVRLAEDDDSLGDQNSLIEYTLPANGTYTIVVNNFGEDRRAGLYSLTLR